ncbi:hypothetical protein [Falsirhodobacter algicola]|uniref:Uncharacterized protein n=1 Tax=Falsirhodobacter algicola TaxID=2692330 RepID=A0A8J8MU08_9RHOB|nr:hypothetical protein [Falsirhodobacter algicola]QUS36381.1 hypothetical protein GR316_08960 [Falsirhodobacter algicola]
MQITITHDRPEGSRSGPVTVGWFLASDKGAVMFDAPERLVQRPPNRGHAKSAARCPAVVQMESRYFVVRCPYDLHLGFGRDDKGKPHLINRAGTASPVRPNKLNELLTLVSESEWRFPDRPTVQLSLPYCFIADEPVYMTQVGTFAHYRADPLPGTIFGGRFPIDIWPRPLMWAFEWHDPARDLVLRRGEPLFYVQFEGEGPDRPVQLTEIERTAELTEYLEKISGVVNYVNQTFSLFKAAERVRPAQLVVPKKR